MYVCTYVRTYVCVYIYIYIYYTHTTYTIWRTFPSKLSPSLECDQIRARFSVTRQFKPHLSGFNSAGGKDCTYSWGNIALVQFADKQVGHEATPLRLVTGGRKLHLAHVYAGCMVQESI